MSESDRRFMVDEDVLEDLVCFAELGGADSVLEVGAGTGNLTEKIAQHSKVTAIEKDASLWPALRRRFEGNERVQLIRGDALKVEYPGHNKIVSNIPYSISRQLMERFIVEGFDMAVLVVQKEFAQKLFARPTSDNYRMLSVLTQTTCELKHQLDIPPSAFEPRPKVSSSAIVLKQTWKPTKEYITFLNTLFSRKNKKIRNIIETPEKYQQMRPVEMKPKEIKDFYSEISR
jgi:16S rRNA (adenine1518-N6/adenine1519-N6)-dimethyltransferase